MKYAVTGGAGFIGSNLVDTLISNDNEVIIFDNFSSGFEENINSKAKLIKVDVSDSTNNDIIKSALKNVDTVFHFAAMARVQPSIDDPVTFEKNNSLGTINMLKCSVDANVRRFVYSASSSAYGNAAKMPMVEEDNIDPISPYAMQKYYGEVACKMFCKVYNIETVSLRYFNVYGERQSMEGAYALVVAAFARMRLNNLPLTIRGDGEQRRDFTYVKDVVKANILASDSKLVGNGEVINIGNGDNKSVNEIAQMIGGETINVDPVIEPKETLADNSKAKELLGWSPNMNIEDWIPKYLNDLGIIEK
jgi:nucleoside-diphosphate-sugar epimerase